MLINSIIGNNNKKEQSKSNTNNFDRALTSAINDFRKEHCAKSIIIYIFIFENDSIVFSLKSLDSPDLIELYNITSYIINQEEIFPVVIATDIFILENEVKIFDFNKQTLRRFLNKMFPEKKDGCFQIYPYFAYYELYSYVNGMYRKLGCSTTNNLDYNYTIPIDSCGSH